MGCLLWGWDGQVSVEVTETAFLHSDSDQALKTKALRGWQLGEVTGTENGMPTPYRMRQRKPGSAGIKAGVVSDSLILQLNAECHPSASELMQRIIG